MVGRLEFNVPFQHKYGYIRDKTASGDNWLSPYMITEYLICYWLTELSFMYFRDVLPGWLDSSLEFNGTFKFLAQIGSYRAFAVIDYFERRSSKPIT